MAVAFTLDALADELQQLASGFAARAATAAAPKLFALAQSQWAVGEGADADPWEPLKATGGRPLVKIGAEITCSARGRSIVFVAPDWIKYHQGGFRVHVSEEAALQVALARTKAEKRSALKEAKASGTKVPARAPFPKSNRAMSIAWGLCIRDAARDLLAEELARFR